MSTVVLNKEHLSFCIRRVDNFFVAHEVFLGFYDVAPNIKSEKFVKITKIIRFQLPLQLRRGQCFDSASNMLGKGLDRNPIRITATATL